MCCWRCLKPLLRTRVLGDMFSIGLMKKRAQSRDDAA